MPQNRRDFLKKSAFAGAGVMAGSWFLQACAGENAGQTSDQAVAVAEVSTPLFFSISLAQWSLHKELFDGKMDNLDFPMIAQKEFGISAVEYVNQFFKDKAQDDAYLQELNKRASDHGVQNVLIMIDGEGHLGATDEAERIKAVENHYRWVEAAKKLGCHSIRVNAAGKGTAEEVQAAAVDGLGRLSTFAQDFGLNVIVENHGGYSSNGEWLSGTIGQVGMDNCGTLPDFGNFCITRGEDGCDDEYDRYLGLQQLMPFAKGVSAKSHDFDEQGNEIHTDYAKMLQLVKDAGYTGYIGVEYEGSKLSEYEGIKATKALLERIGSQIG
ncbi:sugar phosphate isomerase/epimerase family protein [Pontibacter sp. G13]|uniref:sugar phosphate isomerase/epimerase family protein n=1 Tax=Pontibacter sp. G13 TaxID=3074898 RepID=UPI00288B46FE|nr:sugar phosphate isomerase/epimerase family protein [Pontibacter sp. G13]WNJ21590.1 sugar phosphate isomerase/epimerase family protein [Pontibacter sp. G13]